MARFTLRSLRRTCGLGVLSVLLSSISAPVAAQKISITLSPQVVTFPSSDPDLVPVIDSPPVQATVKKAGSPSAWILTALAMGDLISGPSTIGISNVSWVGSPSPDFRSGTLSKVVPQVVASGAVKLQPTELGLLTFRFNNSWTYSTGTYTQTVVFTISAP